MIDDNFHSRIELSGRIKTLFYQLQKEPVNRHLVGKLSKEIIGNIRLFTDTNYQKWDYYKKLCRDLPSYSFTPNISEIEDLKELIPNNAKEKIDYSMKTKFEKEIFEFFEKLNIQIDDNGKFDYDYILSNLFILEENCHNLLWNHAELLDIWHRASVM